MSPGTIKIPKTGGQKQLLLPHHFLWIQLHRTMQKDKQNYEMLQLQRTPDLVVEKESLTEVYAVTVSHALNKNCNCFFIYIHLKGEKK